MIKSIQSQIQKTQTRITGIVYFNRLINKLLIWVRQRSYIKYRY